MTQFAFGYMWSLLCKNFSADLGEGALALLQSPQPPPITFYSVDSHKRDIVLPGRLLHRPRRLSPYQNPANSRGTDISA